MDIRDPDCAPHEFGPVQDWPIGRLFAAAAHMSRPVSGRLVEAGGTSASGFLLLRELIIQNGQRGSDLARAMLVTPATVTTVADTLERQGYVERRRDTRDRRAVRLHITEAGRGLVAVTTRRIEPFTRDLYAVVDEADEPAVRRFLLALLGRFDAILNHADLDEVLRRRLSEELSQDLADLEEELATPPSPHTDASSEGDGA